MRYRYRGTGVVVESDLVLDSAIFTPLDEKPEAAAEPAEKQKKTVKKKKASGKAEEAI